MLVPHKALAPHQKDGPAEDEWTGSVVADECWIGGHLSRSKYMLSERDNKTQSPADGQVGDSRCIRIESQRMGPDCRRVE